jgi:hypothetical protein
MEQFAICSLQFEKGGLLLKGDSNTSLSTQNVIQAMVTPKCFWPVFVVPPCCKEMKMWKSAHGSAEKNSDGDAHFF